MKNTTTQKENKIPFLIGFVCLFLANIPNLYGALVTGQTAPIGYLILLEIGLLGYLLDAAMNGRPPMFLIAGVSNTVLNAVVLMIALIDFVG